MKAIGIDIGSLTTKIVILDMNDTFTFSITPSGDEPESSSKTALEESLGQSELNLDHDFYLVSTGIGGKLIPFAHKHKSITTCLARGVHSLFPTARMAIDIGAESCNVLKINEKGRISDWVNHDKCAAVPLEMLDEVPEGPLGQTGFEMFGNIERDANRALLCHGQIAQTTGRAFCIGNDGTIGNKPVSNALAHGPYPDLPIEGDCSLQHDFERKLLFIGYDRYARVAARYQL